MKMSLTEYKTTTAKIQEGKTMKLKRSHLIHFVDAGMAKGSPEWFKIGKDVEDMSIDMGVDTETKKNILDETTIVDNGYEPTVAVDTYYADTNDAIYDPLVNIAMNRETGDACKSKVLEVLIEDTEATSHRAWIEDAVIKPTSYGGAQGGVQIPFTIGFDGNRKEGTVTIADGVPTFVAN